MTGVHALRFAAAPRHNPDSLLRSRRIARGIRVLARCVLSFAAHIDDRVAIRGKAQARQFLPVILAVFCDLPGRESGAFGHPDISPAFLVQRSEEHTSELQSLAYLVCRLLLEKKKNTQTNLMTRHKI